MTNEWSLIYEKTLGLRTGVKGLLVCQITSGPLKTQQLQPYSTITRHQVNYWQYLFPAPFDTVKWKQLLNYILQQVSSIKHWISPLHHSTLDLLTHFPEESIPIKQRKGRVYDLQYSRLGSIGSKRKLLKNIEDAKLFKKNILAKQQRWDLFEKERQFGLQSYNRFVGCQASLDPHTFYLNPITQKQFIFVFGQMSGFLLKTIQFL